MVDQSPNGARIFRLGSEGPLTVNFRGSRSDNGRTAAEVNDVTNALEAYVRQSISDLNLSVAGSHSPYSDFAEFDPFFYQFNHKGDTEKDLHSWRISYFVQQGSAQVQRSFSVDYDVISDRLVVSRDHYCNTCSLSDSQLGWGLIAEVDNWSESANWEQVDRKIRSAYIPVPMTVSRAARNE